MARYITDPSTIRAHCMNGWGVAPPIERIEAMQAEYRNMRRDYIRPLETPCRDDGDIQRLGALPIDKQVEVEPEPVIEPKRVLQPASRMVWPEQRAACVFDLAELIDSVARDFDISHGELIGTDRQRIFVNARWVVWRILMDRGWSNSRAAAALLRNDHSTVIHAMKKFDIRAKQCPLVRASYEAHRAAGWCK
jgi:hypothetical protein